MSPLRVMYALGPGDVVSSYEHWKNGINLPSETSRTFSGQFFDFCARYDHEAYAISHCERAAKVQDGKLTVENRPKPRGGRGLRHHVAEVWYGIALLITA